MTGACHFTSYWYAGSVPMRTQEVLYKIAFPSGLAMQGGKARSCKDHWGDSACAAKMQPSAVRAAATALFRLCNAFFLRYLFGMTNNTLNASDFHLLQYFAVVAEENNVHRAAQRLFMAQPPLSRHIKRLEERLGLTLFIRHTRGLSLTEDGARVLAAIRPLLRLQAKTFRELEALARPLEKAFALGLTTALEQGVFTGLEARMRERCGQRLRVMRNTSPKLLRDVRKGRLDAALVALPLETPGLTVTPLAYEEPLAAALPAQWPEAAHKGLPLRACNGKPLFWFRRESNPAFFDFTRGVFNHAGYAPVFLEEPAEHDVLLARIAAGEGMGLLPASFAAIRREGVAFAPVAEGALLRVQLGVVAAPGKADAVEELMREALQHFQN